MNDTPGPITDKYRAMLLRLSPPKRLAMACRMLSTAKALAQAGIRCRSVSFEDPTAMRREVFLHFYRNDFSRLEVERILDSLSEGKSEESNQ